MIVVSDTSPITNLIQIHQLPILKKLFYEVVITPAVYAELCDLPEQKRILSEANWIKAKQNQLLWQSIYRLIIC